MNPAISCMPTQQARFAGALLKVAASVPDGLMVRTGSDPAPRFAIHRNNVVASLVGALASTFPVTRALVGEAFFRELAHEFVRSCPPRSPVLLGYGDALGDFIDACAPARAVPYLGDVARLERMRVEAYHARDARPLDADAFRPLLADPQCLPSLRFGLHPAVRVLRSRYAVASIWHAHQPGTSTAFELVDPDCGEDALVTRPLYEVEVTRLPPGGASFVSALANGERLGNALQCASRDGAPDPTPQLALLIGHGLAEHLQPPGAEP